MKYLILATAIVSIVGCGMNLGNWGMSKEDSLRSNLSHSWSSCKTLSTGSAQYILDFSGEDMTVDGQTYKSSDCSGTALQYYRFARYSYSNFVAINPNQGSASVQQLTYYSNKIEAEDGLVRIGSKPILKANADFVVSSDAQQMALNLNKLVLDDSKEGLQTTGPSQITDSSTISLKFQRYSSRHSD
jgi:hypothetical protein